MRRSVTLFLLGTAIVSLFVGCLSKSASPGNAFVFPYFKDSLLSKSLLPPSLEVGTSDPVRTFVVTSNGTIHLLDINSMKILGSFPSGPPIYSSYQASLGHGNDNDSGSDFYLDLGEDWELYIHSKRNGKVKVSAEELLRKSPVLEGGAITLGSKKISAFTVDLQSGNSIFSLTDSRSISGMQSAENNQVLLKKDAGALVNPGSMNSATAVIVRTDYGMQKYSILSGELLCNLTFATFEVLCGLDCQTRPQIFRLRNSIVRSQKVEKHDLMEFLAINYQVASLPHEDRPFLPPHDPKSLLAGPVYQSTASLHSNEGSFHGGGEMLPLLPAEKNTTDGKLSITVPAENNTTEGKSLVAFPAVKNTTGEKSLIASAAVKNTTGGKSTIAVLFGVLLLLVISIIYWCYGAMRPQTQLREKVVDTKAQDGNGKRKKTRRSGNNKNDSNSERRPKTVTSPEGKVVDPNELSPIDGSERNLLPTLTNLVNSHVDGRRIGKLLVSNKEIAKGSNGTVVLEGVYDGRQVAVKRLVRTHHDVALKEIQNLIASDQHPNVVRWYGVEYDLDFIYLSLERGACNFYDLIYICSETFQSQSITGIQSLISSEYTDQLHSITDYLKGVELWKANGYPSSLLLKLMRDVVSGLSHLHEVGIIHRDLKPQNVLIMKDRSLCAKLSDMGISKRLLEDRTSLTQNATGSGSSGWQAAEQLVHGRQTRAVDIFSLGCVLFFCITGGKHPFGDSIERDVNIVSNRKDLFLVESIPEAMDLLSGMLDPNPDMRPNAMQVLHHPLFWNSEMRLSFLRDASDRVELEDREKDSVLLNELESVAAVSLNGKWDERMEMVFLNNIGRYRRYKFDSVRDLLRVIRNKLNHYRELPQEIQELLGPVPEGFESYFSRRFPRLVMEVYGVMYRNCREEEFFSKYIKSVVI